MISKLDKLRETLFNNIKGDEELIRLWKKGAAKYFMNKNHRPFLISICNLISNDLVLSTKQRDYLRFLANN